jgi:replicative DNA helicase
VNEDGEVLEEPPPYLDDPEQPSEPAAKRYGARSMAELLDAVVVRAETQRPERGVTCGNADIDEAIGGFRRQRVTIVGAETSFGKSSFAVMCADEGIKAGAGILLVTGEDGPDTYGQRIMARRADVNALRLRDNVLLEEDIAKMKATAALAQKTPFFIDGIGKQAEYLARAIRDVCAENAIALVIVDYVQAFSCAKRCQDRRTEVTHIARTFVDAIKSANAAGLLLSQLKRPDKSVSPPTMHDLKESGDLENMAEHVLLGHLEQNGERVFYIGKNKDGVRGTDRVPVKFNTKTASFETKKQDVFKEYDDFDSRYDPSERKDFQDGL